MLIFRHFLASGRLAARRSGAERNRRECQAKKVEDFGWCCRQWQLRIGRYFGLRFELHAQCVGFGAGAVEECGAEDFGDGVAGQAVAANADDVFGRPECRLGFQELKLLRQRVVTGQNAGDAGVDSGDEGCANLL